MPSAARKIQKLQIWSPRHATISNFSLSQTIPNSSGSLLQSKSKACGNVGATESGKAAEGTAPYTHLLPANQPRDVTPARGRPVYSHAPIPPFSFCFSAARQPDLLQMFLHPKKGRLFYCELLRSHAAEKQKGSFRSFAVDKTGHPLDCCSQKMRVSCREGRPTPKPGGNSAHPLHREASWSAAMASPARTLCRFLQWREPLQLSGSPGRCEEGGQ